MMTKKLRVYLGDGVYASADDFGGIWLTTEDGISVTNQIYLEPFVYRALNEFVRQVNSTFEGGKEWQK